MKAKVWKVCVLCLGPDTGFVVAAPTAWDALNIVLNHLSPVTRAQANHITVTYVWEKEAPLNILPGMDAEGSEK